MLNTLCNGGQEQISVAAFVELGADHLEQPDQNMLDAITRSFSDHPDLLDNLESMLQAVSPHENVFDDEAVRTLTDYLHTVCEHYKTREAATPPASGLRGLLSRVVKLR